MNEPKKATQKAKDLIRMAVNKARMIAPIDRIKLSVTKKAMVIGGGITGMTAALNFANQEMETHLIEKEAELGGFGRHIYNTLEGGDVQAYLKEMINKVENHPHLKVYKNANIIAIDGYIGNFKTTIEHGPNKDKAEFDHGVVIVATGAQEYKPKEYLYGENDKVVLQSEFEKMLNTNGEIKNMKSVVMIQCVGSRNEEHPYCSKMCCAEAIKNALLVKKMSPSTEVTILFRDIRTYGFKEKYYRDARAAGVIFLRFDENNLPEVTPDGDGLRIEVVTPSKDVVYINSDQLVLSAGIVAEFHPNEKLAMMLKVPLNDDNFFLEAHVKLRPVDFATEGVFVAGLAHCPKTIEDSISQANAAVSRACTILGNDEVEAEGKTAFVDMSRCSGCGMCVDNCAYNAIELIEDRRFGLVASINTALCKGCGACSGNCRCSAIDVLGFSGEQIYEMITGRL